MDQTKKFIIGGGITGLIWNFYHPEYQIITPDVGGQFTKKHLVWMHDTMETRKLLADLGFSNPAQYAHDVRIGFMHDGWITEKETPEQNHITIQKKMTEWDKPIDTKFVPSTTDMSTSKQGKENYMRTLNVDLDDVIRRLEAKARIINGKVKMINETHIMVETGGGGVASIPYDHLISSIPAPVFWKYVWWNPKGKDFKSLPTTNVETSVKPEFFDDRFEMMYYGEGSHFSRVSKLNDVYVIEFTGTMTKEQFEDLYPEIPVTSCFTVNTGRIFKGEPNTPPQKNIIFSGRFAQWEYGITSEHIVKQALDFRKDKKNAA